MNKVIRITESDLTRIVKRVLNENVIDYPFPNRKTISIINNEGKNVDVDCELAQTPEEKKQGLLYRDGIEDNCGVLFDSDRNSAYHIVDMSFPINDFHKWGSDSRNHKSPTRSKEYYTRG